jgi:hypothetical protein
VADFRGNSAREILFERKGMSWSFEEIRKTWEDTTRCLEDRIDGAREYIRSGSTRVSGVGELEKNG